MTQLAFIPPTHTKLVQMACGWMRGPLRCHVILPEFKTLATEHEVPDVIGWTVTYSGAHSVLVECKASRADFLADKKKDFRIHPELGMGFRRWFFTAPDIVQPEELPDGWGLAEWSGGPIRSVRRIREPGTFNLRALHHEVSLLVQAMRRDNSTNPAWTSKTYKGLGKKPPTAVLEHRASKLPSMTCPKCGLPFRHGDYARHFEGCPGPGSGTTL